MKKLIFVVSPPACGKTYVSKKLAERVHGIVYLDKDTLIPLSKQIFKAAGEEYNRSSDFFKRYVRDAEYEAILGIGFEAILYAPLVLINAPFTKEIRSNAFISELRKKLAEMNAKLVVIWVQTDPEICRVRMIARNSERDKWKLEHWDEYIQTVDFSVPEALDDPTVQDDLLIFHNSSDDEFEHSMKRILPIIINS